MLNKQWQMSSLDSVLIEKFNAYQLRVKQLPIHLQTDERWLREFNVMYHSVLELPKHLQTDERFKYDIVMNKIKFSDLPLHLQTDEMRIYLFEHGILSIIDLPDHLRTDERWLADARLKKKHVYQLPLRLRTKSDWSKYFKKRSREHYKQIFDKLDSLSIEVLLNLGYIEFCQIPQEFVTEDQISKQFINII